MLRINIFYLFFYSCNIINAQQLQSFPNTASSMGMGMCINSFKDIRSVFSNPAAIATVKRIQFSSFIDQKFNVNELKSISVAALVPTSSGNFSIAFNRFGFTTYNETSGQVSYGRKLFNNLSIGGAIQLNNISIEEYGTKSIFGFQLGTVYDLSKNTSLLFSVQNIHRPKVSENDKLPGIFSIGILYKPSEIVSLHTELYKELDYKEDLRFGIEYQPSNVIVLRVGGHTYPAQLSFGFGVKVLKSLIFEASTQYHSVLGFNPGIGLSYGIFEIK